MIYRFETFKNDKRVVFLQPLKVSHLSVIPDKFYESPKLKKWMCELSTFSQIQSNIIIRMLACMHVLVETTLSMIAKAFFFVTHL